MSARRKQALEVLLRLQTVEVQQAMVCYQEQLQQLERIVAFAKTLTEKMARIERRLSSDSVTGQILDPAQMQASIAYLETLSQQQAQLQAAYQEQEKKCQDEQKRLHQLQLKEKALDDKIAAETKHLKAGELVAGLQQAEELYLQRFKREHRQ